MNIKVMSLVTLLIVVTTISIFGWTQSRVSENNLRKHVILADRSIDVLNTKGVDSLECSEIYAKYWKIRNNQK